MKTEDFDFIQYDKDIREQHLNLDHDTEFEINDQKYAIKFKVVVEINGIPAIVAEKMAKIDKYKDMGLENMKTLTYAWWDLLNDADKSEIIRLINN